MVIVACNQATDNQLEMSDDSLISQGQKVFKQNCEQCHSLETNKEIVGPSLAGIATRARTRVGELDSKAYIQTSIIDPGKYIVEGFNNLMPANFKRILKQEEIDALTTFLLTLE